MPGGTRKKSREQPRSYSPDSFLTSHTGQYATYLAVEVIPEDEAGVEAAVASEVDNSTTLEAQETNMDCPISLGNTSMMPIKH